MCNTYILHYQFVILFRPTRMTTQVKQICMWGYQKKIFVFNFFCCFYSWHNDVDGILLVWHKTNGWQVNCELLTMCNISWWWCKSDKRGNKDFVKQSQATCTFAVINVILSIIYMMVSTVLHINNYRILYYTQLPHMMFHCVNANHNKTFY